MWPWGHAAAAYLAYAAAVRWRDGRRPTPAAALPLVVAAQLPDVVDKPLAWTLSVLPYGRSLGHSLLVVVPAVALLWWAAGDEHPAVAGAVAAGVLTHPLVDALGTVLRGDLASLTFLLWPALPAPAPTMAQSFLAHLLAYELGPVRAVEFALVGAALLAWRADGYPGTGAVMRRLPPLSAGE
jgi:hypothetical protein